MKGKAEDGGITRVTRLSALACVSALLLLVPVVFSGCSNLVYTGDKIGVVVSIMPQAEFVENVGGNKVDITVMVPQNADPHTYEPKPGQMRALSKAGVYFKLGSGIEFELAWMDRLTSTNQGMIVVDCSSGIQLIEMTTEETHGGVPHGVMDPHIWMSPLNARIMVKNICDGLIKIDLANRLYYEKNRDFYLQKLIQLDNDIKHGLAGVKNRKFLVYHPAFGYFAKEYNLTMLAIEEEGKEPTAVNIARLIQQAKENNIKVVFASPQFNPQSAKVIASAIGGKVIFIDNLSRDYIANMRFLLGELVEVMD